MQSTQKRRTRADEEEDCVGNAKAMQQEMKEERAREREGESVEEMKEVTASREAYDYGRRGQTCKAPGNNSLLPLRASIPALALVCVSFSSFSFSFFCCCLSAVFRLSFCQAHRGCGHVPVSVFGKHQVTTRDGCVTRTRPSLIGAPEGFVVFVSSLSRFSSCGHCLLSCLLHSAGLTVLSLRFLVMILALCLH